MCKGMNIVNFAVPHPVVDALSTSVCLFIKDMDKDKWNMEVDKDAKLFKEALVYEKGIREIDVVISLRQLKREFKTYEAKRKLSTAYDMFLCDERVLPLVSRNLGKSFHKHKALPYPISITASNIRNQIKQSMCQARCILKDSSTRCSMVVGRIEQSTEQLYENISATIDQFAAKLPGGDMNVRSIYLSTDKSPQLPLFVCLESANMVKLWSPTNKRQAPVTGDLTTLDGDFAADRVKVFADGRVDLINEAGSVVPWITNKSQKTNPKRLLSKRKLLGTIKSKPRRQLVKAKTKATV